MDLELSEHQLEVAERRYCICARGIGRQHHSARPRRSLQFRWLEEMRRFRCARFADSGGVWRHGAGITETMPSLRPRLRRGDHGLLFSINAHLWTNSLPILVTATKSSARNICRGCVTADCRRQWASEPDAGSDVFSMRMRAERRGDTYVLNGTKTFVSNAPVADLFAVYATIDPALGPMGITSFLVERGTPGLTIGRKLEKMGLRTSPMSEITFDDCDSGGQPPGA